MPFIALILLILCHFLSGYGLLYLFGIRLKTGLTITLSLLLGIAVASVLPFLLQLCYVPLTEVTVFGSLAVACVLLNIRTLLDLRKGIYPKLPSIRDFRMELYEVPYILVIAFFVFVSVWRCYYLPPTSRDALSGPEAIAEFAYREHTLINSFFNVDLFTTNNQFKSPFLIDLQLIYKMAGFPFGQVWLSVVFVSFIVLLYHLLRERVHPVIAGALLLIFLLAPEMYAYSFMILYDYSNAVFFFLSLYFLFEYSKSGTLRTLYFSGLLMGIATYTRSETLALAVLFLPLVLLVQYRAKYDWKKIAWTNGLFILPALLGYYLPTQLYIRHYLPVHYEVANLINPHLSDPGPLFDRYGEMLTKLMTGTFAIHLWGYIMFVFGALLAGELIFLRQLGRDARNWLYAVLVVFIGLGLLGFLLPLFDLTDTTKRALFKILPLMLFYLANNGLLLRLSTAISRWEQVSLRAELAGKTAVKTGGKAAAAKTEAAGKNSAAGKGKTTGKPGAAGNGAGVNPKTAATAESGGKGKKKKGR